MSFSNPWFSSNHLPWNLFLSHNIQARRLRGQRLLLGQPWDVSPPTTNQVDWGNIEFNTADRHCQNRAGATSHQQHPSRSPLHYVEWNWQTPCKFGPAPPSIAARPPCNVAAKLVRGFDRIFSNDFCTYHAHNSQKKTANLRETYVFICYVGTLVLSRKETEIKIQAQITRCATCKQLDI